MRITFKTVQKADLATSKEGIVEIYFHENAAIEKEDALAIRTHFHELLNGQPAALLINAKDMRFISREARKILAEGNGKGNVVGNAILVRTSLQKSFAKLYMKFASTAIHTKVFTSKRAGKEWLLKLLNKQNS